MLLTHWPLHPMLNKDFHYQFSLADKKEKLDFALRKVPRIDKEVSYLRQEIFRLKIAIK